MGNSIGNAPALLFDKSNANENQFLMFQLGNETYAIGILHIKEIIEYGDVTTVPMVPAFIRGVINLRGRVVPVIDLQACFGRDSSEVSKRTCIVIIEVGGEEERHDIGVVVDSVSEVIDIQAENIEPPPSFGARIRSDFIHGMGKINGKFVIILNVDSVLSLEDMAILASMAK